LIISPKIPLQQQTTRWHTKPAVIGRVQWAIVGIPITRL
jgi:hypothetical protein